MAESSASAIPWPTIYTQLRQAFPAFTADEPNGPLNLQLDDEDWELEVTPEGLLICQAGYSLDDMKSLLSDGTPEDLGTDELAKQAKFYLQQTVSKHSRRLKQEGFSERMEMNDDYVAVFYERPVPFDDLTTLKNLIQHCRRQFR